MRVKKHFWTKLMIVMGVLGLLLALALVLGLSTGAGQVDVAEFFRAASGGKDSMADAILYRIRLPRVLAAAFAGAALSLGGLVFQAILKNPLSEPYILGVSGGSAVGAILGILAGFSRFPGVGGTAFTGSMATLGLVVVLSSGRGAFTKEFLILAGVMVNAFCSAFIMFLMSMTQDNKLHTIMFWLMGDLSSSDMGQFTILACSVVPCFMVITMMSHRMNLMLLGRDKAESLGVDVKKTTLILMIATSFMVSATVCQCGLLGFVGLVIPHIFRLILGSDHRVLAPACIIGGASYLVFCDMTARWLPSQGEIPVGVVTAMIGVPLFIILLRRKI
jgi:iron complex transport system permease protein